MSKDEITGETIYNLEVRFINKDKSKVFKHPHRIKFYENDGCSADIIMPDIWFEHKDLDKYVSDLEAKLAESEKQRQHLKDWLDDEILTSIDNESYYATINEYEEEVKKLKQYLAEKEKIEYTDTINFVETSEPDIVAKELDRLNEQLAEKDKKIESLQTHFKKTQELLEREMCNSNIVIDNLQKEMKQALANQKDYYEKRLKFIAKDIIEKIRKELGLKLKYKLNDEVSVLKICNQINEVLDTILKDYQK